MTQFYLDDFYHHINNTHLKKFDSAFEQSIQQQLSCINKHGDYQTWKDCIDSLPDIKPTQYKLNQDLIHIGSPSDVNHSQNKQLTEELLKLSPWRKGPFKLFDTLIDCEWRSDWKWQRLAPHISDLSGRYVLDVGCGSGYHSLRMQAQGAACVIAIDPAAKFFFQYLALKKYLAKQSSQLHFLPLTLEQMPSNMRAFDSIFSMGVLYHRRSPFDHLDQLKRALKPGGELILETLVIEGDSQQVLVPHDRYACMRNVWFIPSVSTLHTWLARIGFSNIRTVDINYTTTEEQRSTAWMNFRSLQDFLDPNNPTLTIEGYPAPQRAIILANS